MKTVEQVRQDATKTLVYYTRELEGIHTPLPPGLPLGSEHARRALQTEADRLRRWKNETRQALSQYFKPPEVNRFAALRLQTGGALTPAQLATEIRSHRDFLDRLRDEARTRPARFDGRLIPPDPGDEKRSGSPFWPWLRVSGRRSEQIPVPPRVTLRWLIDNLSIGVWIGSASALAITFAAGYLMGTGEGPMNVLLTFLGK